MNSITRSLPPVSDIAHDGRGGHATINGPPVPTMTRVIRRPNRWLRRRRDDVGRPADRAIRRPDIDTRGRL